MNDSWRYNSLLRDWLVIYKGSLTIYTANAFGRPNITLLYQKNQLVFEKAYRLKIMSIMSILLKSGNIIDGLPIKSIDNLHND